MLTFRVFIFFPFLLSLSVGRRTNEKGRDPVFTAYEYTGCYTMGIATIIERKQ